ncbi:Npt1/Npt2 family nucleotide transporter [Paenibacillus sp. IITD108]|uniref:Npt1/Npt2 family nucleotide transporter n=1 Tax=Paenibacillus sp. IITD108 TaxID=3116649 RepID=UPI002F411291
MLGNMIGKIKSGLGGDGLDRIEYRKVWMLFTYLFCVVSASVVGRTAADALLLSRFDSSLLSKMYLPQAAALIVTGLIFQKYGPRVRMDKLILRLIPAISLLVFVSALGVSWQLDWILPIIYVLYDVFNFLMIVCFWQFTSFVLDQRKAKRTIGIVGSGGLVGSIISGFGIKVVVAAVGTANLIFFYGALQLAAFLAVLLLVRMSGNPEAVFGTEETTIQPATPRKNAATSSSGKAKSKGLFQSVPHLMHVAIMLAAMTLALTLIDYQFKVILKDELQNDALAGFMGTFYGMTGLLALAVQFFVAGKVLTKFGVMTALLVFPVVLLAGSIGVLALPVLAMVVLVKGSDKVVGDTINSSVNQLIMLPVPPKWRSQAKGFLDGTARNGAKGAAAIALIFLSPLLTAQQLGYIIVGLLVISIGSAITLRGAYVETLLSTLESSERRFDGMELDFIHPASMKLLLSALTGADQRQALYALRTLHELEGFDLEPYLPGLLRHRAQEVVISTLDIIASTKPANMENELYALMDHGDTDISAHALMALAAYGDERHLELITGQLESERLVMKTAAIAGLIKYYGIEGMFRAVSVLKPLLDSRHVAERAAVAELFGLIGIREFHKPLIPLLQDDSPQVLHQAIRSAGQLRAPELVPYVVPLLQRGEVRKDAIETLASGKPEQAVALLEPYFHQEQPLLHLPKVFERMAAAPAFDKLLSLYGGSCIEMRNAMTESLVRLQRHVHANHKYNSIVEGLIVLELNLYWGLGNHTEGLLSVPGYEEITELVIKHRKETVRRIFHLLSLIHDAATIRAVYANWSGGDARKQANAMELIDQLVRGQLRLHMVKLMNDGDPELRAARTAEQIAGQLRWLETLGDRWLNRLIAYAADPLASDGLQALMKQIDILRSYSLFQKLSSRDLSVLAEKLEIFEVSAGEYIFRETDEVNMLFLVAEGRVGIYHEGVRLAERQPGEAFGQLGLLVHHNHTADALAVTNTVLWRLDSETFYEVMFDRSDIAIEMMRQLSARLRKALARQHTTAQHTISESQIPELQTATAIESGSDMLGVVTEEDDSLLRRILILRKVEIFAYLAEDDIVRLAQMVDEVRYEAGEDICLEGDYGDTLYGIIEGSVTVHVGGATLASLGEGDCFGEMAIIDSAPRSANCTAATATVLLQLQRDQVFSLCFQNIDVLRSMIRLLEERLKGMAA